MYPPVDPDELARHATEVGRVLLAAGLAPAGGPRRWPPLAIFDSTRLSARLKAHCYRHFRRLGLLLENAAFDAILFYHLLHTAWLLAHDYIYQDLEGLYWVDPRQPYDYDLSYELAEATLAELIGLGELAALRHLLREATGNPA